MEKVLPIGYAPKKISGMTKSQKSMQSMLKNVSKNDEVTFTNKLNKDNKKKKGFIATLLITLATRLLIWAGATPADINVTKFNQKDKGEASNYAENILDKWDSVDDIY